MAEWAGAAVLYRTARELGASIWAGLLSGGSFLLAPYVISTFYGRVALPEARRGVLTAFTLAWARALGEFGPVLVFCGATRMRTEVLSTSVFLELSAGNLEAALAVSLLMIAVAVAVLTVTRAFGPRGTAPV